MRVCEGRNFDVLYFRRLQNDAFFLVNFPCQIFALTKTLTSVKCQNPGRECGKRETNGETNLALSLATVRRGAVSNGRLSELASPLPFPSLPLPPPSDFCVCFLLQHQITTGRAGKGGNGIGKGEGGGRERVLWWE